MQELIKRQLGVNGSVDVDDLSSLPYLGQFEQIVLLWPDGNGMGWYEVEEKIFREKNATTPIHVLNGRNRLFELQRALWRGYRLRRFLEKTFLLEFGALGVFFVSAPALTLWDMVCGRREKGE
jgi:hypothetical protein